MSEEKLKEIEITAKRKRGKVRLPSNIKAMEASRTVRPNLESEIYVQYRFRKDNLKLPISFAWFKAVFRKEFKSAGEVVPTNSKIQGFLKRRGISLLSVRDTKSKTVEQRIDKVRDQLCRYDEHQRRPSYNVPIPDAKFGRVPPNLHFAMDEFCLQMSVESRRSYGDRGSDENHVKSLDSCRELSAIALFNFGEIMQPKYAYAIIPLKCKS